MIHSCLGVSDVNGLINARNGFLVTSFVSNGNEAIKVDLATLALTLCIKYSNAIPCLSIMLPAT